MAGDAKGEEVAVFRVPNEFRELEGPMASTPAYGKNGAFTVPHERLYKAHYQIIASNGEGWEHVSVHVVDRKQPRTPAWDEMCYVKSVFWDEEDIVVQFHPRKSDYVNLHPYVLHLWRQVGGDFPHPRSELVGWKSDEDELMHKGLARAGLTREQFDAIRAKLGGKK